MLILFSMGMGKEKSMEKPVDDRTERVVLATVVRDRQEVREAEEYLDELRFLAETAGFETASLVSA